jgi:hypothetical protein
MQNKRFEIALIGLLYAGGWASFSAQSPTDSTVLSAAPYAGSDAGTKGTGSAGKSPDPVSR